MLSRPLPERAPRRLEERFEYACCVITLLDAVRAARVDRQRQVAPRQPARVALHENRARVERAAALVHETVLLERDLEAEIAVVRKASSAAIRSALGIRRLEEDLIGALTVLRDAIRREGEHAVPVGATGVVDDGVLAEALERAECLGAAALCFISAAKSGSKAKSADGKATELCVSSIRQVVSPGVHWNWQTLTS